MVNPDAAAAAPGAPGASAPPVKPLGRPQTPEELAFYAPDHFFLTVMAVILCPPLGLAALHFRSQIKEDNKNSYWEGAYLNSSRTVWLDVFAILIGLGVIYGLVLYT
uniref:transmembrane protein PMIS2-like n=1 Tax=Jaculus jaculus TaxID=51337 RepID=UPI001E1B487F|nr:transmembrane protein PMIS2-like [Jaculus jaculus]